MTSAAAMISGGTAMASGGGHRDGGTTTRLTLKDSRTSLVPTPDPSSLGRARTRSPSASLSSVTSLSTSPALPMAGMMMHEPERIRMRTAAAGNKRRRVKDFNDGITCTLCDGYLVEATSVNDCLHAFCRSCIVKYLESNKYCPRCKSYNSKPITVANLRPDRTLRALVYKLVPGLHKSENQRMVQFYASISSNIVSSEDDPDGPGTFQLLDDQNFFSPDEPISLSLEYHYDTLAEHSAAGAELPVTYLQCPAAVTMHHLYKFILTKNGLVVGSDNIRVDIIYEDEVLPHDFTLMDVAYCFHYRRIAPMRFFYRILIHATAKLAPTASAYHGVEGQDKNSTGPDATADGTGPTGGSSSATTTTSTAPATSGVEGQRPGGEHAVEGQQGVSSKAGPPASRAPREQAANNSAPAVANGHHHPATTKTPASTGEGKRVVKSPSPAASEEPKIVPVSGGLKMVLVPKGKSDTSSSTSDAKRSPPPLKAIQAAPAVPAVNGAKQPAKEAASKDPEPAAPVLKCYVNLKKQTVVGGPAENRQPAEIPRLKIDLPRMKAKLSIPREPAPAKSPPSSGSSSAATSPSSASSVTSSAGKSPVWPMGKEEYAKTIGLKPVYAACTEVPEDTTESSSSSHRKRKKGKHSKEPGSSGKRRKLHAEISSQQDASLKMKVKLTEKPPKHERLRSSGNEEEPPLTTPRSKSPPSTTPRSKSPPSTTSQSKSPPSTTSQSKSPPLTMPQAKSPQSTTSQSKSPPSTTPQSKSPPSTTPQSKSPPVPTPPASPPKAAKVIDITKDDDDVKFVPERRAPVEKNPLPMVAIPIPTPKDKLSEMRNVRHKPMVYIPNLDRSLSIDAPGSTLNALLESVTAKAPMLKPTPALIPTSTGLSGKSQPRTPILTRPMTSCPPLAYPIASSPVTSTASGSIRTMATAASAIKRSMSTDNSNGAGVPPKVPRFEPPTLVAPAALLPPAKQPIQAPMFNFAKGANRAKAAQQAAGITSSPPSEHVPYRSPIGAAYTKEIPAAKKPVPNLLLPPVSVSVTKRTEMVSSSTSSPHDHGRPAVEIVRISSNAPVADKPTLAPFTVPKVTPKTTRPPPATIPLIKVKHPVAPSDLMAPPGMAPLGSSIRAKIPARSPPDSTSSGGQKTMDLSGGAGKRFTDEVIVLDQSPPKKPVETTSSRPRFVEATSRPKQLSAGTAVHIMNRPLEMITFPVSTATSHAVQKTLAPVPKLTEINRNRNLTVRQPNASIRSIPNPSALAFRGTQTNASVASSNSTSTTSAATQMSTVTSSSVTQSNGSLTASGRVNGNAGSTPLTAVKSSVPLSNGSAMRPPVLPGVSSGNGTPRVSTEQKPPATNGTNSANNNNNNKIANANTAAPVKKTIENVAAVLKAAAAIGDTMQRGTPASLPTTTSSSGADNRKPPKDDKTPPPSGASSALMIPSEGGGDASPLTTAVTCTTNRTSVTGVTTSSIAGVTSTNGGSRSSPASIVNVG